MILYNTNYKVLSFCAKKTENKEEKMEKENILGTEKIGKLMRKFSIPCIISLVVNSLYNVVD